MKQEDLPKVASSLDPDEMDDLKIKSITTRGELDRWEQQNAFQSFGPDDIFFFATEKNPDIEDESEVQEDIENDPLPYMMLLSGAAYWSISGKSHEGVSAWFHSGIYAAPYVAGLHPGVPPKSY